MKSGLLIFFIFCLFGCQNRDKIPKNILPQKKMQAVLWDMIRADKFLTDFILKDTTLNKDTASINLYQKVFRIHHISKEEFQLSFTFYKTHPALLKTMFDSLNSRPPGNISSEVHEFKSLTDTSNLLRKIRPLRKKD